MESENTFDIFLVAPPGLEPVLADEARERGFQGVVQEAGGVTVRGDWTEVWRANLQLRCAVRILARFASFRAMHLAQLDKRARKIDWAALLPQGVSLKVEATCRKSKIYHDRAAAERVKKAVKDIVGAKIDPEAQLVIKLRIEDDLCTFSIDTTGESLHKRGHKEAVNKAPMRENLAAAFLCQCGYDGTQVVVDPMCGSGTFIIEAAEMASGLYPGRTRGFAFQELQNFDPKVWQRLKDSAEPTVPPLRYFGSDRDQGAARMSAANATRAGVMDACQFTCQSVSDLSPPEGVPAGLVIVNPPYGARIGNKKNLFAVYGALGKTLKERFHGWRVGIVTSEPGLAKATGLDFLPALPPVPHGGMRIALYRTAPLP